ncbi:MAG: response regulator, partial [Acidobacteriota bacterium]
IVIRISDNGCGISQENLTKIFDPFFTTKEVGQGTGLGLSICYGIIQEHRGRIHATSVAGQGTTFTVELPILDPPPGVDRDDIAEGMAPRPAAGGEARPGTILVIDDEASIVDVLHQALRLDGHRVDTAGNGRVALRKIRDSRYDVIISDLKMPGMSGEALYERVREIHPDLAQRIIFSTGDVASQETREFLHRCGNRFLQKPFDLETMRNLIAAVLANPVN